MATSQSGLGKRLQKLKTTSVSAEHFVKSDEYADSTKLAPTKVTHPWYANDPLLLVYMMSLSMNNPNPSSAADLTIL